MVINSNSLSLAVFRNELKLTYLPTLHYKDIVCKNFHFSVKNPKKPLFIFTLIYLKLM